MRARVRALVYLIVPVQYVLFPLVRWHAPFLLFLRQGAATPGQKMHVSKLMCHAWGPIFPER
jgi:hypothetical protein